MTSPEQRIAELEAREQQLERMMEVRANTIRMLGEERDKLREENERLRLICRLGAEVFSAALAEAQAAEAAREAEAAGDEGDE